MTRKTVGNNSRATGVIRSRVCAFSAKPAVRYAKHYLVVIQGGFDHFTVKHSFSGSQRSAVFVTQLGIANMLGPDPRPFALTQTNLAFHFIGFLTPPRSVYGRSFIVRVPFAQVMRGDR